MGNTLYTTYIGSVQIFFSRRSAGTVITKVHRGQMVTAVTDNLFPQQALSSQQTSANMGLCRGVLRMGFALRALPSIRSLFLSSHPLVAPFAH